VYVTNHDHLLRLIPARNSLYHEVKRDRGCREWRRVCADHLLHRGEKIEVINSNLRFFNVFKLALFSNQNVCVLLDIGGPSSIYHLRKAFVQHEREI
jgi:hypothetical protein